MTTKNIVFIDSRVADLETLIASLGADTEWYVLSAEVDGIEQMQSILAGYTGLDSIQVISHGAIGTLYLGSTVLNSDNLGSYQDQLQVIGSSLTETGDILLYGCDVAQGEEGVSFINSFAQMTGADVAASVDATGAAALGGDWMLEQTTGRVEAATLFIQEYPALLASGTLSVSGSAQEGGTLSASLTGVSDLDGSITGTSYQWQISSDGKTSWTDLSGATNASYVIAADQSQVGQYLRVVVSTTDTLGGTSSFISGSSGDLPGFIQVKDLNLTQDVTHQTTTVRFNLHFDAALVGSSRIQAALIDLAYAYGDVTNTTVTSAKFVQSNGQEANVWSIIVDNLSGSTANGKIALIANFDANNTITDATGRSLQVSLLVNKLLDSFDVSLRSIATGGTSEIYTADSIPHTVDALASQIANVDDEASGTLAITGAVEEGATINADISSLNDVDGGIVSMAYQWQINTGSIWSDISGATTSSLSIPDDQSYVDSQVRLNAVSTDAYGGATNFTSAAQTVANVNDAPTGEVKISGTAMQGETLTASNTLADLDGLGTIGYQWQAGGENISGAMTNSLTLTQAEVGKAITVVASYTDNFGQAENVTSTATAAVANIDDVASGTLSVSGSAQEGGTLSASLTGVSDLDGSITGTSYQWQISSDGKTSWTDLSGATNASYVIAADQSQVGQYLRVVVSTTDQLGGTTSFTSAAQTVTNVNDLPTGSVTISGTAAQGETLTAANSLVDLDGLGTISYQWQAGGQNISGATADSLTLTQAEVGQAITVVASYTDSFEHAESATSSATAAVNNVNDSPTGSVTITGTATQGQTLTAANSVADADGLGAITYTWLAGTTVLGTGASYTLTQFEVDKVIKVTASYTDGYQKSESVSSLPTTAVANIDDAASGTLAIFGTATDGATISANTRDLSDVDGGIASMAYQWQINTDGSWSNISGATASSLIIPGDQSYVDSQVRLNAVSTDAYGGATNFTSAAQTVANVNDAPTGEVKISGTAMQGETLTASNTLADLDGLGTIGYQWQAGGENISGAMTNSLTLTQAEVGKAITVVASYTDNFGQAENVTSTATAAVANIDDVASGTLSVSGSAQEGGTLSASLTGVSDLDGSITGTSYQWQISSDGKTSWTDLSGATNASYVIAADQSQVGQYLRVVVSTTDQLGGTTSFTSAAQTVTNVNDLPTGSVTISGTAAQGETLTASNSLADLDGLGTISYQWQAGGENISGATSSTFSLTQAQVGKVITVVASYTDSFEHAESATSIATAAVNNVNDSPTGSVTITGTATQGQTLTAANSVADADGLGAITYTWLAGTTVLGTGASYTLTQFEVDKVIKVTASYTDGYQKSESVSSLPTTAVANIDDAASGTLAIFGTATDGATISANTRDLSDVDGGIASMAYQWQINTDGSWSNISGATASSLIIPGDQSYVDSQVRLSAVSTDAYGGTTSFISAAQTVVNVSQGATVDLLAYSWKAHTLLEGVAISGGAYSGATNASGALSLVGVTEASLALTAARSVPDAEVAATNGAVNLQDAIAILKMIVGLEVNGAGKPPSPYQTLAADFDGNGAVGLTDAIGVLKHVVGLDAPDPAWKFVNETEANPSAASAPGVDLSGATGPVHLGLVGYLTGDVDGSYAGASGASVLETAYFETLVADNSALNLAQFGIYSQI